MALAVLLPRSAPRLCGPLGLVPCFLPQWIQPCEQGPDCSHDRHLEGSARSKVGGPSPSHQTKPPSRGVMRLPVSTSPLWEQTDRPTNRLVCFELKLGQAKLARVQGLGALS